jgi:beta-glucosidase
VTARSHRQLEPDGARATSFDPFLEAARDDQRVDYDREAISALTRCIEDGIDVRGYYAWPLLDNFEWLFGYGPRFAIVAVDRETQKRTPKRSAHLLGDVARHNAFDRETFR